MDPTKFKHGDKVTWRGKKGEVQNMSKLKIGQTILVAMKEMAIGQTLVISYSVDRAIADFVQYYVWTKNGKGDAWKLYNSWVKSKKIPAEKDVKIWTKKFNKLLSQADPEISPQLISKMAWTYLGRHRATWMRKYLRDFKAPDKYTKPKKVLYRVMKLSQKTLDELKGGKLPMNDFSSWADSIAGIKHFKKLDYFLQNKGKWEVTLKIKPTKKQTVINLTDFMQDHKKLQELYASNGWNVADPIMLSRAFNKDFIVNETILRDVVVGKSNIYSVENADA